MGSVYIGSKHMSTTKEGLLYEKSPQGCRNNTGWLSGQGHCTLIYASTNHTSCYHFLCFLLLPLTAGVGGTSESKEATKLLIGDIQFYHLFMMTLTKLSAIRNTKPMSPQSLHGSNMTPFRMQGSLDCFQIHHTLLLLAM